MLPNSNNSLHQLHQSAEAGLSVNQQLEQVQGKFAGLLREQLQQSPENGLPQSGEVSGLVVSTDPSPVNSVLNSSIGDVANVDSSDDALEVPLRDSTSVQSASIARSNLTNVNDEAKKVFEDFVGQTFFSTMLASLRSTQGEAAYMNGGRAEEIFRGQLDQYLSEYLSDASAEQIAEPMYERFSQQI